LIIPRVQSLIYNNRMDLHEDKEKNVVTASFEFPGSKKEDVQLEIQNGRLTVSVENKISEEYNESGYAVRERRFGKLSRTLQLPQGVKVIHWLSSSGFLLMHILMRYRMMKLRPLWRMVF
jgi:HSP20 family molecular chaperone IbpA